MTGPHPGSQDGRIQHSGKTEHESGQYLPGQWRTALPPWRCGPGPSNPNLSTPSPIPTRAPKRAPIDAPARPCIQASRKNSRSTKRSRGAKALHHADLAEAFGNGHELGVDNAPRRTTSRESTTIQRSFALLPTLLETGSTSKARLGYQFHGGASRRRAADRWRYRCSPARRRGRPRPGSGCSP